MQQQILEQWRNGWSVANIATKHQITAQEVMSVLRANQKEWVMV